MHASRKTLLYTRRIASAIVGTNLYRGYGELGTTCHNRSTITISAELRMISRARDDDLSYGRRSIRSRCTSQREKRLPLQVAGLRPASVPLQPERLMWHPAPSIRHLPTNCQSSHSSGANKQYKCACACQCNGPLMDSPAETSFFCVEQGEACA
jgi:hypothetical protein